MSEIYRRLAAPVVAACATLSLTTPLSAQTSAQNTDFKFMPYDEDYSRYADPALRTGLWEKLKYIPLGDEGHITLGGEIRPRAEFREHLRYGLAAEDQGINIHARTRVWADVHFTQSARAFVELRHSPALGQDRAAVPGIDKNGVEFHHAFLEFSGNIGETKAFVRAGRQEIVFGRARMFDNRESTNTRRAYDAVRFQGQTQNWRYGLIGGYNLRESIGHFDEGTNKNWRFVAAHASRKLGSFAPGSEVEVIYLHTDRKSAPRTNLIAKRHTLSTRVFGREGPWEYDVELIGQTGDTRDGRDVRAWYVASDGAYHFEGKWKPRLGWRADIASGDKDPNDGKVQSYDYGWAKGLSFTDDVGYTNLASVGPVFGIRPTPKLSFEINASGMWRVEKSDGVYALSGAYLRQGDPNGSRYVGLRTVWRGEYRFNPHVATGFYVNRTFAGDFLEEAGNAKDLLFATVYTTFRF